MDEPDRPHSAQFLTDTRDLWWNADFLALVAARLDLARVRRAVDVGSGLGHWTRTLARVLPRGVEITGVEREQAWVDGARAGPEADGATLQFVQGTADALPCADASVDLVTCQTLLIHVPDPGAVLAEMARVLRPGGVLLLAEPNNLPNVVAQFAALPDVDVDDLLAALRLQLLCERGKRALGLGYNSLGEGVVGLLGDDTWADVRAWSSDKVRLLRPPYSTAARLILDEERRQHDDGIVGWPRAEQRRYYDASGGDPAAFDDLWVRARRLNALRLRLVDEGRWAAAEGGLHYLVAARRR